MIDELKQWEYDRGYEKGKTDALDKIRAEIEQKIKKRPRLNHTIAERERNDAFLEVLDIINKYKAQTDQVGNPDRLGGD